MVSFTTDGPQLSALDGGRPDFDPESVPAYPLLRATIRQTDAGDLEGLVDNRVVATDTELEPVRRAVIAEAARTAAKRHGPVRAIRVQGTGQDGSMFHLVVTATGQVYEVAPPGRGGAGSKSSSKKTTGSTGEEKDGFSCLFLAVMAVPVLLLGVPLVLVIAHHLGGGKAHVLPPKPSPTELPVVVPPPYSPVAAWSQNLGTATASTTNPGLAADGARVYAPRDSGANVAAYSAATGRLRWMFTKLDGSVTAGPTLVSVDGHQRVAVASDSNLVLLNPATGREVSSWKINDTGSGVQMTPSGPVVLTDATHAQIVVRGHLVTRVVPATGTPVAPTSDGGLLVTGSSGQVWTVRSDAVASAARNLAAPSGTSFDGVAGWSGSQLVLAYHSNTASGSNEVRLVAYTPGSWRRNWMTGWIPTVYTSDQAQLPLAASPNGGWGIYGQTAIDLVSGHTARLPQDWTTTAVGDAQAFGTGNGKPLIATTSGVTKASAAGAKPPDTTTVSAPQATWGNHAYLVTSADGSNATLFALQLPGRHR